MGCVDLFLWERVVQSLGFALEKTPCFYEFIKLAIDKCQKYQIRVIKITFNLVNIHGFVGGRFVPACAPLF
jgi:hypothetical protein